MLKDIRSIKIQGANFEDLTQLPLLSHGSNPAKATLLYGRNGSGKSTIARAFRKVKGVPTENIQTALMVDSQESEIFLTDEEKAHIFVFDEAFVNENVRVQEDGLGSIVMLGEQAGLAEQIESITKELRDAEEVRDRKKATLEEYNNPENEKSPWYYIGKMCSVLKQEHGWADRKRIIDGTKRNASVNDTTYKSFINLSPIKGRDDLYEDYLNELQCLKDAQSGTSKITTSVPNIPSVHTQYSTAFGDSLLRQVIEHPKLTEREKRLLSLVQTGHGEELKQTATEFQSPELTICPKCHQPLSEQYKVDLINSIQRVLSEEVKNHQNALRDRCLQELDLDLAPFQELPIYQTCVEQIEEINSSIRHNNALLQSKIDDPYTPISENLFTIVEAISSLVQSLGKLESERDEHNDAVTDTRPIKEKLKISNDEIAYWDVIELCRHHDARKTEMDNAERDFNEAQRVCTEKQDRLNNLNAQRDSIDIAIDVLNDGLKYIFFSENRMQIRVEDRAYRLVCNGYPVKPKDVSVGERNIIGLCYFFTNILKGKSCDNAYTEEYLLVIDDPVSSYDLENRVGILSYLKYELSKFLLGNTDSRALVMTHDLFTALDVEKIYGELISECNRIFNGHGRFNFSFKELRNKELLTFHNNRNEYTTLLKVVYDYANGGASEQELYIGNIIRQVLEAFSTFEFKKSIDGVSVDNEILAVMEREDHRSHFKNLMYRLVLNEGSHRYDQTRNMQVDFFSFISEPDKRRTAKEVLCFMLLLNSPHVKAHLGSDAVNVIKGWCDAIGITEEA